MKDEKRNIFKFIKNIAIVSILVAITSMMMACGGGGGGGDDDDTTVGGDATVGGDYWLLSSADMERDGITDFRIAFDSTSTWNVTAISYVLNGTTYGVSAGQMTQNSGEIDDDTWFDVEIEWQQDDNNVVFGGAMNATSDFATGTVAYNIGYKIGFLSSATLTKTGGSNDTTPPTVMITSPDNNTDYNGVATVTVTANADDDTGVTKVEFYRNDVLRATDTAMPYEWTTDLTAASNGEYALIARAYDAGGNVTSSAPINVIVDISSGGGTAPTGDTWLLTSDQLARATVTDFRMTFDDDLVITEISYFLNGSARRFTGAEEITRSSADVDPNDIDFDIEADWGTNNSGLVFGGTLNDSSDATSATGILSINIDDGAIVIFDSSSALTRQ